MFPVIKETHIERVECVCPSASGTRSQGRLCILQVVPTVEQEASGPAYSVPRLCAALGSAGNKVVLASVGGAGAGGKQPYSHFVAPRGFRSIPLLRDFWFSAGLRRRLMHEVRGAELVHSHGMWVMPTIYPALATHRAGKPLVIAPRGTLSPIALARSRWMKKVFWAILQGPAVRSAACFHATSEQEYRDIRRAGLRQPVAIVPNGVDIPAVSAKPKASGSRTLLYLGRIHPIKGIDNLLRAWQRVASQFPNWQLRLVGPDSNGYRAQLERLSTELQLPRVVFAGPRYGADKQTEYAAADLYVLPSHTENFGMSAAEALAQGVPIVTSVGTPWQGVREHGCGWCVSADVAGLEGALKEALALDRPTLESMGRAGREWMGREFSWTRVARDLEQTYRWLLSGGPPPAFIRFD